MHAVIRLMIGLYGVRPVHHSESVLRRGSYKALMFSSGARDYYVAAAGEWMERSDLVGQHGDGAPG